MGKHFVSFKSVLRWESGEQITKRDFYIGAAFLLRRYGVRSTEPLAT
jgi:hypothetical protein